MKKRVTAYALLAIALTLIIAGAAQGDFMDTLHKAAVICLECIGIG